MTHNGVNVFHTYKDDDIGQGERRYWYTVDRTSGEDGSFDVRELDVPAARRITLQPWGSDAETLAMQQALRDALDAGLIELPDDPENNVHVEDV